MIEADIAFEKPIKDIAKGVRVSHRSVQYFNKNLKLHSFIAPPKVIARGLPHTIILEMEEVSVISPL
jgi:hypothetical protein